MNAITDTFCYKMSKITKKITKAFRFGFRKACGQVLIALNFFPKQDLYYANI